VRIELGAIPTFTSAFGDRFYKLKFPLRVLRFYKEMRKALSTNWDTDTICFIETTHSFHLAAIKLWKLIFFNKSIPSFILLFRSEPSSLNKFFINRLKTEIYKRKIFLITDSEIVAQIYKQEIDVSLNVFPIPHIPELLSKKNEYQTKENLKFFIPLNGRGFDKGIITILKAIDLLKDKPIFRKMTFILKCDSMGQFYMPSDYDINKIKENLTSLKENYKNIEVIFDSIPTNEYYNLLILADAVILPFKIPFYFSGSSGVFAEAVAASKPVIVSEKTWMANESKKLNTGLIVKQNDETDLIKKIEFLYGNFADFQNKANLAAIEWKDFHTANKFLNMLLNINNL